MDINYKRTQQAKDNTVVLQYNRSGNIYLNSDKTSYKNPAPS